MKAILVSTMALLAIGSHEAVAQTCPDGSLTASQISSALGNKWACAKDGTHVWNERITGALSGTFGACNSGLTTGPDPIDPNKGTFNIVASATGGPDTITYTYPPSGGSYTYRVYAAAAPSTYTLCRVSDNKIYNLVIATCPPSAPGQCP